jgi:hypothetical protein
VIGHALEIGRAAERLFASGFTEGFTEFDRVRARYRNEPWYRDVHGNYTWAILPLSVAEIKAKAPAFRWGTPFDYDPMPTLSRLSVPQLWVLGGEDLDAPSAETSRRLRVLVAQGRPITLAFYPAAEHGMTEFELKPDGTRVSTRYAAGYFRMLADYAKRGRLDGRYGAASIEGSRGRH